MNGRNQAPPHANAPTDIILESISDGVFTVDGDWRITSFNRAAEEVTGLPRAVALGQRCSEVFHASACETDCPLRRAVASRAPVVSQALFIVDAHGRRVPISVSASPLMEPGGRMVGGVETFRDLSVVEELRKELEGRYEVGDLLSRSPSMRRVFEVMPQVAASFSTVLIEGETGTGKELLARAIHEASPRRGRPFVAVNCAALPDTLLESELFGYKAGAFTGATKDKPGRFALAEGGTLFLDEIGEVSPALQVRLLRVLQERAYEPLGGVRTVSADVRVIAATNRGLAGLVEKELFRRDLFYRIHVVKLALPPLRKRKEDIPLLAERFIEKFNRVRERRVSGIGREALSVLMAHDFPGNVRELENLIEHAFILCGDGPIELAHLPDELVAKVGPPRGPASLTAAVKSAEVHALSEALRRNHFNRLATARELGLHKSTFFRKLKALGISVPVVDGRSRVRV
ncbi:MAG: sigma 54-interacting transcriptional regulator [Candidatus Riflebacteria bacterium]|nr:sigma 54-interacting transcriptional regulator [Candidatus Riflebacteria bacterium]